MKSKSNRPKATAVQLVRDIRRAIRSNYRTEEKMPLDLSCLLDYGSIAELCCEEGIAQALYYSWSNEFLKEVGKKRLAGDSARAANLDQVRSTRSQVKALREVVANLKLENLALKFSNIQRQNSLQPNAQR
jgi:transposase